MCTNFEDTASSFDPDIIDHYVAGKRENIVPTSEPTVAHISVKAGQQGRLISSEANSICQRMIARHIDHDDSEVLLSVGLEEKLLSIGLDFYYQEVE